MDPLLGSSNQQQDMYLLVKIEKPNNNADIEKSRATNFCQTCLSISKTGYLKDMTKVYSYNGSDEVYSEMLGYCFSLQVEDKAKSMSENIYMICEPCINKLRVAAGFRKLVYDSQETIKQVLECGFPKAAVKIKQELEITYSDPDDGRPPSSMKYINNTITTVEADLKKEKVERKKSPKKSCPAQPKQHAANLPKVKKKRKPRDLKLPYKLEDSDLQCKICSEEFPTNKGLKMHMPNHFPNFTCDQCGRVFAVRVQLTNHMLSHSDGKHECPYCPGRVFKIRDSLNTHIKIKHEGVSRHKCPECGERFLSYEQRRRHLIEVHEKTEILERYPCKMCDKRFVSAGYRSRHYRTVHLREKPHLCKECPMQFYSSHALKRHIVKHSGVKAFSCDYCHRKFGRKSALIVHLNNKLNPCGSE